MEVFMDYHNKKLISEYFYYSAEYGETVEHLK